MNLTDKTVLIVDSDALILSKLENTLQKFCKVHKASKASEALEIINQNQPDMILMDIELPDMSGFELIDHIREHSTDNGIEIIITSAKTITDEQILFVKTGAKALLNKPATSFPVSASEAVQSILMEQERASLIKVSQKRFDDVLNMLSDVVVISDQMGTIKAVKIYLAMKKTS